MDTKQERLALFPTLNELLLEIGGEVDPYLSYLRGVLLMRMDRRQDAIDCFVQSVKERPYNWSCWSQMAQLVNSADMVSSSAMRKLTTQFIELKDSLPTSPMLTFFAISVMLDLHTATDLVMSMIRELHELFPTSVHLKAQEALGYYHMRGMKNRAYACTMTDLQNLRAPKRSLMPCKRLIHSAWRR